MTDTPALDFERLRAAINELNSCLTNAFAKNIPVEIEVQYANLNDGFGNGHPRAARAIVGRVQVQL